MKRFYQLFFLLIVSLSCINSFAQDTLPKFTVRSAGNNRVIIGWVNNYPVTKQISIQRSFDSLNSYKTIISVTDPAAIQNGFADTKAPNDHMFYRLFINVDKGEFFFTKPKRPQPDTTTVTQAPVKEIKDNNIANVTDVPKSLW